MSDYFSDVADFHVKFELPVSIESRSSTFPKIRYPNLLSESEFNYRISFLFEEIRELIEGQGERNLAKVADSIVDAVYVLLGTAHYMGLPFDTLWEAVHRANMTKRPWREGDPIKPRNVQGLEIVKPEGWVGPNIQRILDIYSAGPDVELTE